MAVKIRPIENRDFPDWLPLWDGNNMGQRDEEITAQTWSRLVDPASPVNGLVAEDNGKIVGLVHYTLHPTTGCLTDVCYMQDVYTDPAHRRKGIAKRLISSLHKIGKSEKWSRIYWLAEGKNEAAQTLYQTVGMKLDFTFHVMKM